MKKTAVLIFCFNPIASFADVSSQIILSKEKGALTCSGGGSAKPLFTSDCQTTTVTRISDGGSIKYEVECKTATTTRFQMACDAYAFEFKQVI